jgi:hypothetical protein
MDSSYRDEKNCVTTWVRKCVVAELSERAFTERTQTRPDCRNCTNVTKRSDISVIMHFLCNL